MFVLVTAAEALIVIEYGRTYRLLRTVLAYDVAVHTALQIAGVELRYTEASLLKHGSSAGIFCRVIASGKAGIHICVSCGEGSAARREAFRVRRQ